MPEINQNGQKIEGSITKNTSYFTFALVLQKIISFTYFTLLARNLGPENLGKYYFAISFTTIFIIIADLGLANVLTREIAKKQADAKRILGSIITIKMPLVLVTIIAALITASLRGYDPLISNLIYISVACVILDSFTTTFWAVVRGFHNLLFESISSVLFQIIVLSVGLSFLYAGFGLTYIMSALLAASAFHFIYSFIILWAKIGIAIKPYYDKYLIKNIAKIAVPFALFAIFQRLYMYLDSVFLKEFAGDEYVGYYQISFKIIFALQFLPMAFVASLYPAMSNFWLHNRPQLTRSFEKALIYLTIISIPISAGVVALADKIVLIFKEGYQEAVLPMQIIILAVLFVFINFPIGSLLNACDRQKRNTANMIIATIISIALNLILIPRFQAVGASITVLVTSFLMVVLGIYFAKKTIDFSLRKVIRAFFKILISGILMGILVFYLKSYINILIVIPIGAIIYFILLFAFRTIKKDEVAYIYSSFLKK